MFIMYTTLPKIVQLLMCNVHTFNMPKPFKVSKYLGKYIEWYSSILVFDIRMCKCDF